MFNNNPSIKSFVLVCPCPEASKGRKNSAYKVVWKRIVDVRYMHLFHWNFFIMGETMDPNYADVLVVLMKKKCCLLLASQIPKMLDFIIFNDNYMRH